MRDVTLSTSSREGVEIDFCPQCRGVWLDRSELDKIIERAAQSLAPAAPAGAPAGGRPDDRRRDDEPRYDQPRYDDRRYDDRRRRDDDHYRKKKKRSFLEDLFDFD